MIYAECHPERKHWGHGLCGSCYQMKWRKDKESDKNWKKKHLEKRMDNYYRRVKENPVREKEKSRNYRLKQYGLSFEDYESMRTIQGNKCAICSKESYLHVDHDHETGNVRGLLCQQCNTGLGLFKDNVKNMESAVKYIKESFLTSVTTAA